MGAVGKQILCTLCPLLLLLWGGCDSMVGTLTVDLVRSWAANQEPIRDVAAVIRIRVDGPDLLIGPELFDKAAGSGTLEVPVGERRRITVDGLGLEEEPVSRGRTNFISIDAGDNHITLFIGRMGRKGAFSYTSNRMQVPRAFHSATLLDDGSVLVCGGITEFWRPESSIEPPQVTATVERADGNSLVFPSTPIRCDHPGNQGCMFSPRLGHSATRLTSGNVLLAGGVNSEQHVNSVEVFDPRSNSFLKGTEMQTPRVWHRAVNTSRGTAVIGGVDGANQTLTTAEVYEKGFFEGFPSMSHARRAFTLTALADGSLLACGGFGSQGEPLSSTEVLGPNSTRWLFGPELHVARAHHTATLLEDGTLLLIGGLTAGGQATGVIERVVLADNKVFIMEDPLRQKRWAHTATLLADRRILVVGGFGANINGAPQPSVEGIKIFDDDLSRVHVSPLGNMGEARAGHSATRLGSDMLLLVGGLGSDMRKLVDGLPSGKVLDTAEVFIY